jgi:DNA primase
MLWARETESAAFDTPERRAALEARVGEVAAAIGHETVRRHYRQELEGRLQRLFAPPAGAAATRNNDRRDFRRDMAGNMRGREFVRGRAMRAPPGSRREWQAPVSAQLGRSPIVRGSKSGLPPREALMLLAVVNHPWLLEEHAEEFANLEFLNPAAEQLRRAILEVAHDAADSAALRAAIEARGLAAVLARVEAAITHSSDWPARADAAPEDVAQWWTHVIGLHRKKRTLNRELKDAERALGDEPTDANLAWLRDVQGRLSALDGSEAVIEGFGSPSGRSRSL